MTGRVVIVGASLGGLRTAEQLRANGFTGEITVIGAEPHMPYQRPPLSKEALAGTVDARGLAFRIRESIRDVRWRLRTRAVAADLHARTVTLAGGDVLSVDGLVVATGLTATRLPLTGADDRHHVVRTVDDMVALRGRLGPGVRLTVVGAGFVGCEVAATASTLGADVTVVGSGEVPMRRALGHALGAELRRRHEAHGVRFLLRTTPTGYSPTGVVLDDGREVPADVVVEAVGCSPATGWLAGNGLDLSDGVLCDNWLRVRGFPHVVAVGDVARFPNPRFDDVPRRVEHWSIPSDTARRAARTLIAELGHADHDSSPFTPMPTFWSDQHDARLLSFGAPGLGADDVRVLDGRLGGQVVIGFHRANVLTGVVGLDAPRATIAHRARIGQAADVPT